MQIDLLYIPAFIHFFCLCGLAFYGLHRLWLLYFWLRHSRNRPDFSPDTDTGCTQDTFFVTVQIPLYNEPFVAQRIIDAAAAFDWPKEKLEIQVLDDSSDRTRAIVKERVKFWQSRGISIYGIFRKQRTGYKAGALQNGLKKAKGELIAIFDADFIPPADFLPRTVPCFCDESVGMVQARWGFINSEYSWLTRLQALMLSPHFGIEHETRAQRGLFFNFNGTAGVWRKKAIESSGGWQDGTVTEDLDLSYRAQMSGWRFVYRDDVRVPSELPVRLSDFRAQQTRWSMGSVQTARKILPRLMVSDLSLSVKLEAFAHLMANFCWLFAFLVPVTVYFAVVYRIRIGMFQALWVDIPLFLTTTVAILTYYAVYAVFSRQPRQLFALPLLPFISLGLSPWFAFSVIKGLFIKGGIFNRTPKFGISGKLMDSGSKLRLKADMDGAKH